MVNHLVLSASLLGGVLLLMSWWPHISHMESKTWGVYMTRCDSHLRGVEQFLATGVCDEGKLELNNEGTRKDCQRARTERAFGIYVCAITSRLKDNSLADVARYLMESWYAFGVLILVIVLSVNGWFHHRTAVRVHQISTEAQHGSFNNMLQSLEERRTSQVQLAGGHGSPPPMALRHHGEKYKSNLF